MIRSLLNLIVIYFYFSTLVIVLNSVVSMHPSTRIFIWVSSITIFTVVVGNSVDPKIVDDIIKDELDLWNPKSEGRQHFVSSHHLLGHVQQSIRKWFITAP